MDHDTRGNSGKGAWASGTNGTRLGFCAILVATLLAAAAPLQAADVIKGAQVYARHCAACHGPGGISVMPGAPQLARAQGMMQSDMALLATLQSGKNAMPAYLGILNDNEIMDVIAYSRTLR